MIGQLRSASSATARSKATWRRRASAAAAATRTWFRHRVRPAVQERSAPGARPAASPARASSAGESGPQTAPGSGSTWASRPAGHRRQRDVARRRRGRARTTCAPKACRRQALPSTRCAMRRRTRGEQELRRVRRRGGERRRPRGLLHRALPRAAAAADRQRRRRPLPRLRQPDPPAPTAGPTTSTSRCGTPTARRTSCWRCCVRNAPATSRGRVLAIHEQGGWLPRWALRELRRRTCMTGDPVTPFLVDLWRFGALKGSEEQAYAALRQNADGRAAGELAASRAGRATRTTWRNGFVPVRQALRRQGHGHRSAPRRFGDARVRAGRLLRSRIMAEALGHERGRGARCASAAGNWRKLWDAERRPNAASPASRARAWTDGEWLTPVRRRYSPRSDHGFHEGTAWQYQWLVPAGRAGPDRGDGRHGAAAERGWTTSSRYDELLADPRAPRARSGSSGRTTTTASTATTRTTSRTCTRRGCTR